MKEVIIEQLYKIIKVPYDYCIKKKKIPWKITEKDLLEYPHNSLGYQLGCFLKNNNLKIQKGLEEHDMYHILTGIGTTVKNEIELQFYLFGNGKKSPFVFIVIATGILFYPSYLKQFYNYYKRGRNAYQFYHLDFIKLLKQPIQKIKQTFNII